MRQAGTYSVYELDSLPGCSQVAVSHAMFIKPEHRGKKHALDELAQRFVNIKVLGYDYAICTVADGNEAELKTLKKFQFRELDCFTSSKTGHLVHIYGRRVEEAHSPYDINPTTNRPYWES